MILTDGEYAQRLDTISAEAQAIGDHFLQTVNLQRSAIGKPITLYLVYQRYQNSPKATPRWRGLVTTREITPDQLTNDSSTDSLAGSRTDSLSTLAKQHNVAIIEPGLPQTLSPVTIEKPWGAEIWYSGIEARGVTDIQDDHGKTPLDLAVCLFPELSGRQAADELTLVKTLRPRSDALGDLYFEQHQEKQELYLVTAVDHDVWHDGLGRLRFGVCPNRRQALGSDDNFRRQFLETLQAYEHINEQLSAAVADANTTDAERATLAAQAESLRSAVDDYVAVQPIALGDLIQVPPRTPHGLLHGVEVAEFQSPHYEREVIYFNQPLTTQKHWDSAAAIATMNLEPLPLLQTAQNERAEGVTLTHVDFSGFRVTRAMITKGYSCAIPPAAHVIVLGISGAGTVAGRPITAGHGLLLSPYAADRTISAEAAIEQADQRPDGGPAASTDDLVVAWALPLPADT